MQRSGGSYFSREGYFTSAASGSDYIDTQKLTDTVHLTFIYTAQPAQTHQQWQIQQKLIEMQQGHTHRNPNWLNEGWKQEPKQTGALPCSQPDSDKYLVHLSCKQIQPWIVTNISKTQNHLSENCPPLPPLTIPWLPFHFTIAHFSFFLIVCTSVSAQDYLVCRSKDTQNILGCLLVF